LQREERLIFFFPRTLQKQRLPTPPPMLFQEQVDEVLRLRLRAMFFNSLGVCVILSGTQTPSITGVNELPFGPLHASAFAARDFFGPFQTLFDFLLLRHFHDLLGLMFLY
jgi:hypothetical protein